ncbi:hypothetical protein Poli38472_013431 [Pythium oligandrum]|uniref:PQ loop repeat protein n=1 Tax=Pythium oligandrum TaxID=41045 RepID=A0A8K1C8K9_PYTOL|nr:hypothetical protein Poli38472_013431 [Pythium oligandrum]|eukprot:TMW57957.1 hypothetical protein Poli38472_013431 [Pythium oligandrum]
MGSSTAFDILGLVGSFLISAALVPQIQKVYRTKSANDISYSFMCLYVTGLTMIVIYGIGEALWPIYIPCALELLGAISLLGMKCHFDRKSTCKDVEKADMMQVPLTPPGGRYSPVTTPK